jgi:hypothetical protein
MFFHQSGQLEQHLLPIIRLERAPRTFKSAPRRRHGAVDILSITLRKTGDEVGRLHSV